jgi:signal transduction histidine kinase
MVFCLRAWRQSAASASGVERLRQHEGFCTLEALNNIAKYSRASRVEVHLSQTNGELVFEVVDDGVGFDPVDTGYGTGLQGMVDRLDALGGAVLVESRPGEGTAVRGRIPARAAGI